MVTLVEDVTFPSVLFAELLVTFVDCVALETAEGLAELFTLAFLQISDKFPALAFSQCVVKFNTEPLHEIIARVLLGEQISVKLRRDTVSLLCRVAFCDCDVQFEIVALHEDVTLTAVEFCRVELILLDVVFTDDMFAVAKVPFKGAAFA